MDATQQDLRELEARLLAASAKGDEPVVSEPLAAVNRAATEIGRSFGGWDFAPPDYRPIYYEDFKIPPLGNTFNASGDGDEGIEWLEDRQKWHASNAARVEAEIYRQAGLPDLAPAWVAANNSVEVFEAAKHEMLSVLSQQLDRGTDSYLAGIRADVERLRSYTAQEIESEKYKDEKVPPHFKVQAEVVSLHRSFATCKDAARLCQLIASHLRRKLPNDATSHKSVGTKVFIGHGRSLLWLVLKDFLQDTLHLEWDEFNRVSPAGVATEARLSKMLDDAAFALLVLTGEDETGGTLQARMNVVHEVGLFQARLGFSKAIVLLEEGCTEFSNIEGIGHIPFPKGDIEAAFVKVRRVLEREGVVPKSSN